MPVIEVIDKTTKDNFLIKYVGLMKALIKKIVTQHHKNNSLGHT